jgi:drug/metabolite transporter (DMT)-like permease
LTRIESTSSSNDLAAPRPVAKAEQAGFRGYLFIAAATLCWGAAATLGRAIFTGRIHLAGEALKPIDPLILAQTRTTFAFLILMPLLLFRRGTEGVSIRRRDLLHCMILGFFGVAGSNYFYYFAIQKTSVATAIILQYLAPVFVLFYMLLRKLQPPSLQRLSGVSLAVVGSVLAIGVVGWRATFPFIGVRTGDIRFNTVGVVAGLVAAMCFAFSNVFGHHLVAATDRSRVMVYSMMGAAVGWLVVNPPWKIIAAHYSGSQWIFLLVFAIASMLIPYSFYFAGLQYLDATRAIVTSCLEPVFAIFIAALALGELVGPMQILGIVVTLAATILIQSPDKQAKAEAMRLELME